MKRRIVLLCMLLTIVLAFPGMARADIAPPIQPPGSNLEPGSEVTQVRMLAETVVMDVQPVALDKDLGQALVNADFTMRNLGPEAESMAVRFPLGANNGYGQVVEIRNLKVRVNGSPVNTRRVMQPDPDWSSDLVPWSEFDVTFPPNEDVNIQVSYVLDGTGEYPYVSYSYIFHTGAGWKDSIGSADLIVRLPYDANDLNVIFDETTGWSLTSAGGAIAGREIHWRFENLEPDQSNDFEISLVMPAVWQKILNEESNVNRNPNDGEAWGRLGKLYKEIFFFRRGFRQDSGGLSLYSLSVDAYERCLTLLPGDALWHAGYANLLAVHSYYAMQEGEQTQAEMLRSMQEIHLAQQLAPDDAKVQEIAEEIYYLFPEAIQQLESGYDYLWLTATPEFSTATAAPALPTLMPTAMDTTRPTPTALPAQEPTPTPGPDSASNPLCASAFLIPLGLVVLARSKKMPYR